MWGGGSAWEGPCVCAQLLRVWICVWGRARRARIGAAEGTAGSAKGFLSSWEEKSGVSPPPREPQ